LRLLRRKGLEIPKNEVKMFRNLSGLIVLLVVGGGFAAANVCAQQIQGDVRYSGTGQPALNALVECNGSGGNSEQLTSRDGKFYFRVSPGHYTVSVRLSGYREEQQSVDLLDSGSSEYMMFRLKPNVAGTKPVTRSTISADVPAAAQAEFDKAEGALAGNKKENMEEGVRHLEKAIAIYPKFLQAQLKLGTAYMDLQQFDKAEAALKKTLELDSKAANALFALGEVYLRQKKDEDAEKVLLQGFEIENRSFQGHLTLARVYWDMASKIKDDTQARPALEKAYDQVKKALELNPNLAPAHLLKGNLLLRVRRAADAQHEYEEYLRLEPKGPFAEQTRATVEKIKKALESQPKP
jgi:tetratricopeptide (TPR) repeat protein